MNKATLIKQLEDESKAMEEASKGGGSKTQTLTPYNQPKAPSM